MQTSEKAVLKTLLYSDIFEFPLTEQEIWQYVVSDKNITKEEIKSSLSHLRSKLSALNGLYSIKGKEKHIRERMALRKLLKTKLSIAQYASHYLSYIPTIYFIGISGGLAAEDIKETDDIDFFIIVKNNCIWITRLMILAVLELLQLRRKRDDKNGANKICVNMIIDESQLVWPDIRRDIYNARELVQLKPLFERHTMHRKLLESNKWVSKFFFNAYQLLQRTQIQEEQRTYMIIKIISFFINLSLTQYIAKVIQKIYMKKTRTTETISDSFLAFHPYDYRKQIIKNLHKKFAEYKLLTN